MSAERIPFEKFVDRGTLRAAVVLEFDPRAIGVEFDHERDDLDEFDAAYYSVDGKPVVIQRYVNNPPNEYTVSVDSIEPPRSIGEVLRQIFKSMRAPVPRVTWTADQWATSRL
jgi:hypothetical protein